MKSFSDPVAKPAAGGSRLDNGKSIRGHYLFGSLLLVSSGIFFVQYFIDVSAGLLKYRYKTYGIRVTDDPEQFWKVAGLLFLFPSIVLAIALVMLAYGVLKHPYAPGSRPLKDTDSWKVVFVVGALVFAAGMIAMFASCIFLIRDFYSTQPMLVSLFLIGCGSALLLSTLAPVSRNGQDEEDLPK